MPVEQASLPGLVRVLDRCSRAEDIEDGVIKALRSLDVVCAEHDMTEQDGSPVLRWKKTKEQLLVPPNEAKQLPYQWQLTHKVAASHNQCLVGPLRG